ncbi:MAG: carboxy-terminal processing protease, carboxyl-terminal processing protease [Candidatus Daviesbacteria bacterium GW2011_GWC1_40_9]|nr:MAG: carboxy-terminal processing protease, carboxyl-terminal processing protease [Candidatus Daviesbacteria bacterium GW2011_GWC1_40_9]
MKEINQPSDNQASSGWRGVLSKLNAGSLIIVLLAFVLGWQLGHRDYTISFQSYKPKITVLNEQPPAQNVNLDFKLFWQTWDLVSQKYIDKKAIDPQKLYYGAIQGMVSAVGDPYTVFLPPQAQKTAKEQLGGSFEGVGIQLGYNKDKRLVVIAPLKDTPADRAGVKAGDLILQVDGKDTTTLSLPEAVGLIRGLKGSTVSLELLGEKEQKSKEVKLIRDTIIVKTVEFEAKNTKNGQKVGYLRLSGFGEKTKSEWDEAVSGLLAASVSGVIVDVRNNPGGFLEAAVYISSEFLDGGKVVLQEDAKGVRQEQGVIRSGKILRLPLVVLINKGSASASEILAGAIQDRGRGTLVGEQSFGKGTIQTAEDLPQETGIHITTAKWLTPGGRWIHDTGLTPDTAVKMEDEEDAATEQKDPQLEAALEILDRKI